jgi:hypothetical protein
MAKVTNIKDIKEDMDSKEIDSGAMNSKEIEIKIILTENGYRTETSVPLGIDYLMSVLDTVNKDLFVRSLYSREDAPWMRKLGIVKP